MGLGPSSEQKVGVSSDMKACSNKAIKNFEILNGWKECYAKFILLTLIVEKRGIKGGHIT